MKDGKPRQHKILDHHTVIGFLLLVLGGKLLIQIVTGGIAYAVLETAIGDESARIYMNYFMIAASFLLLLMHKIWFRPEYKGSLPGKDMLKWIGVSLIGLLAMTITDVVTIANNGIGRPSFKMLTIAVMAGITEEIIYRAVPGSYLMRQWKDGNAVMRTMVMTSAVFALCHLGNIFAGADIGATVLQVTETFCAGMFLCALFLRSGSIIPGMVLHILNDVYNLIGMDVTGGVVEDSITLSDALCTAGHCVFLLGVGIWLVRKEVRETVFKLWSLKWSRNDENQKVEETV